MSGPLEGVRVLELTASRRSAKPASARRRSSRGWPRARRPRPHPP